MADAAPEQNPLTAGLGKTAIPDPCTLVIFGATGDLTRRKLLPALYNLALDGLLPASFAVVGFARRDWTDETLRGVARDGSEKFSRRKPDPAHWADFESTVFYVNGSFEDREAYPLLQKRLEEVEASLDLISPRGVRVVARIVRPLIDRDARDVAELRPGLHVEERRIEP